MRPIATALLAAAALAALVFPLRAQTTLVSPRWLVGAAAGSVSYTHTGFEPATSSSIAVPEFGDASGSSFFFGATAERELWRRGGPSILGRLTYDQRPASYRSDGGRTLGITSEGEPVFVDDEHTASVEYNLISLDILFKIPIVTPLPNVSLTAAFGPSLGYVAKGTWKQTARLVNVEEGVRFPENDEFRYSEDGQVAYINDGDIPDLSGRRMAAKGGVMVEVALGNLIISPGAWIDYGLTSVQRTGAWKVNSWQFGVDARIGL